MAPHQPAPGAAAASTKSMLLDIGQLLRSKLSLHGGAYYNPSEANATAVVANTATVGINTSIYGADSLGTETNANAVTNFFPPFFLCFERKNLRFFA